MTPTVDLLGIDVNVLSKEDLVSSILDDTTSGRGSSFGYVNAHVLRLALEDPGLRDLFGRLDVVFCDGFGAKTVARILGHRLPERMTPPDWIDEVLVSVAESGRSVYLLGDEPSVVVGCADRMIERNPGLRIAGAKDGFFNSDADQERLRGEIDASGAGLLLVGMGTPLQETLMTSWWQPGEGPTRLAVGGLFKFYSGFEYRPPAALTGRGLEWVVRLARHPMKYFDRYVIGIPKLLGAAVKARFHSGPRT